MQTLSGYVTRLQKPKELENFAEITPKLLIHVRQLAWLSSCPNDTSKKENKDKRNRFIRISEKDPESLELITPEIRKISCQPAKDWPCWKQRLWD